MLRAPPRPPLFPYTTLFRSAAGVGHQHDGPRLGVLGGSKEMFLERELALLLARYHFGNGVRPGTHQKKITKAMTNNESQNRSEEHTSELQSRPHLVCRLLLE